ncbi:chondroitin sulfate synthase 2 [Aricia agestis]|uniref:chondroitin sulfate synthase 2 n=1 Tax=Aricia agestis TaxID=91739 RepID=UPI001C20781A|nr:chondroitin sulfate synthase 2 [Aricia agestis]
MFSRYFVSQVKHNSYFIVGLVLGLWMSLAVIPLDEEVEPCVAAVTSAPVTDEYEPQREERPLGPAGQAGRSVQRPRYYSTELGMRGGLLAGVLSSEGALEGRAAALNRTAARLQPALRFFITAGSLRPAPARANVVGFTDTREMLKPFHALKYLADNYLEEYDFFFLVSDSSFVNSRRLNELASRLSVSQHLYMGTVADGETQYCTLEGGILLSNSVLRAVHAELDWCVRNSYSPHHHENLGRCVLHAAHTPCISMAQGEHYESARLETENGPTGLRPELANAVTVHPLTEPAHFYQLHAYISRVFLERSAAASAKLAAAATLSSRHHPPGYRNASWPQALRADAGLAPPLPPTRFDHLRWTRFNATHAFLPDDHHAVAPLKGAYREAIDLVLAEAGGGMLLEGAWRWEPAYALRYRLLLRGDDGRLRHMEVARPLGSARLAPARYVTESARVLLVLPLAAVHAPRAISFLRRYDEVCLQRDTNTALLLVVVWSGDRTAPQEEAVRRIRDEVRALSDKYRGASLELAEASAAAAGDGELAIQATAARAAMLTSITRAPRDALLLLALPHMEYTEEFLNRVRMNTISGEQWFQPLPFARYSQYAHPRFVEADGSRPQQNTGRFGVEGAQVLAVYRADYQAALESWRANGGADDAEPAAILAASPLRALRAPEPVLLLGPRPPPCALPDLPNGLVDEEACLQRIRDKDFAGLQLGARHALAKLLLETQAELA